MKNPFIGRSGFLQIRALTAVMLLAAAVCLARFSFAPPESLKGERERGEMGRARYMPEPGGKADDFDRMEQEWFTRVTYPTGIFDSAWLRAAADADALIQRGVPAGVPGLFLQGPNAPLALTS